MTTETTTQTTSIIRINGLALHCTIAGAGEPLVFVHGAWTDSDAWRFVAPSWQPRPGS